MSGVTSTAAKAGLAAGIGVERADAHQAMHADFGAQVAVRVRAGHGERSARDAGLVAGLVVDDLGLVACRSHQRRYIRSSISAQSLASVPPAPGLMLTMALA